MKLWGDCGATRGFCRSFRSRPKLLSQRRQNQTTAETIPVKGLTAAPSAHVWPRPKSRVVSWSCVLFRAVRDTSRGVGSGDDQRGSRISMIVSQCPIVPTWRILTPIFRFSVPEPEGQVRLSVDHDSIVSALNLHAHPI